MTDQLPSKEWLLQAANALEHYAKSRWYYSPLFYPDIAVALRQLVEGRAEIDRLREDLQRTESARVALLAENEHYKRRVEELSIHAEKWVQRALTPAHEREAPHCSTCACGVERPLAAGDPVSYLGVETTIREVRTSYILAGGSYATADLLVRRAAQPPGDDQ